MDWKAYCSDRIESGVIHDAGGTAWRLLLSVPEGPTPDAGWPLLWVLDGHLHGQTLIETAARLGRRPDVTGVGPMVVAALSPLEAAGAPDVRFTAYTAGPPERPEQFGREWTAGGARHLLRLLEVEALEAVSARAMVSGSHAMLWGHSLSGWFALWAAAMSPGLFSGVAAISPSLWWDEASLAPLREAPPPIFMAVGALESDDRPGGRRMIGRARALYEGFARNSPASRLVISQDEDHASIVSATCAPALRLLARGSR